MSSHELNMSLGQEHNKENVLENIHKAQDEIFQLLEKQYPRLFTAAGGYENFGVFFHRQIEHFIQYGDMEDWLNDLEGNPGVGKTSLHKKYLIPLMEHVDQELFLTKGEHINFHYIGWDDVQTELIDMFNEQVRTDNAKSSSEPPQPNEFGMFMDFISSLNLTQTVRLKVTKTALLESTPDPTSTRGYPPLFHFAVGLRILQKVQQYRDEGKPYTAIFIEKVGNTSYAGPSYEPRGGKRWEVFREYFPELIELLNQPTLSHLLEMVPNKKVRVTGEILVNGPNRLIDITGRDFIKFAKNREEFAILAYLFQKEKSRGWEEESEGGSEEVVYIALAACLGLGKFFKTRLRELNFPEDMITLMDIEDTFMNAASQTTQDKKNKTKTVLLLEHIRTRLLNNIKERISSENPISTFITQTEFAAKITQRNPEFVLSRLAGMLAAARLSEDILQHNVENEKEYCIGYQNPEPTFPHEILLAMTEVIKEMRQRKKNSKDND